jgi:hypothetical protein
MSDGEFSIKLSLVHTPWADWYLLGHEQVVGVLQHLRCQQPTGFLGVVLGGQLSGGV